MHRNSVPPVADILRDRTRLDAFVTGAGPVTALARRDLRLEMRFRSSSSAGALWYALDADVAELPRRVATAALFVRGEHALALVLYPPWFAVASGRAFDVARPAAALGADVVLVLRHRGGARLQEEDAVEAARSLRQDRAAACERARTLTAHAVSLGELLCRGGRVREIFWWEPSPQLGFGWAANDGDADAAATGDPLEGAEAPDWRPRDQRGRYLPVLSPWAARGRWPSEPRRRRNRRPIAR
jgi:hypothetical protein